eukprot:NODE_963_length_1070_cov_143.440744_g792_i0.p1 GENE.NODE_963_length_1070_cov_143.440744_g792_i0~~NODE_963_length_1070_cov_143.440744_g792_i0.p1  ORF type:complete len:245 (+),score=29.51 NODE_963_length_1070_cov_143.440744_g792_i0:262-996(+)
MEHVLRMPLDLISRVCAWGLTYLLRRCRSIIAFDGRALAKCPLFSATLHAAGAPLRHCIGFIDGTLRPACRPGIGQRAFYSGHRRRHGLKYQGVITPDGMFISFCGPYPGSRHDMWMLRTSGLLGTLRSIFPGNYCLYGDGGYALTDVILCPYRRPIDPTRQRFNSAISALRIVVEHEFGRILALFPHLTLTRRHRISQDAARQVYLAAAVLKNMHACCYGSQTSQRFGLRPPNLSEYLSVLDP